MTPRSPTAEDRNGILMPRSPLMEDDEKLVEKVAREIVDQHGTDAVQILCERADPAELDGDKLAAETWREIAEVANAFGGIAAAIDSEDRRRKRKAGFSAALSALGTRHISPDRPGRPGVVAQRALNPARARALVEQSLRGLVLLGRR